MGLPAEALREMADRQFCWPVSSRRFDVKTALSTAGALTNIGCPGGAILALGSFSGVEISPDAQNWYPVTPGSVWPVLKPGRADGRGSKRLRRGPFLLRRVGGGLGTLVLAAYADPLEAELAAELMKGATPPLGQGSATPSSVFSGGALATGAATGYTPQTTNLYTVIVAEGTNTDHVYIAETSAKATAAAGVRIPPGGSREVYGSFFYFSAVAQTIDALEYLQ